MERVGRYEILAELGRGATGQVYRARDPEIDRLVAVKVLIPSAGADPHEVQAWRERFRREARAAGRLTHPNIVAIHDVGEDDGRPFLVMELVEGESLDQRLRAQGPFPTEQVVSIGKEIAQALDYAHRQGVVHRDIKPANILLRRDGLVKVTDFGIARLSGAEVTRTGQILGTPSYMSPEQIAGGKVDGRSDLFSLAAVLYELLTGEKTFPGETVSTILYRIVHEEPIPIRRLNPSLSSPLDVCLRRALAKDPAERQTSAAELAKELQATAKGRPSDAATTRIIPPRRPPAQRGKRSPWIWGTAAAAGIALAAMVWFRPTPPAPRPPPPAAAPATSAAVQQPTPDDAQRKAEAERLEAERKRLEEERVRLTGEEERLKAERRRMEEGARRKVEAPARTPQGGGQATPSAPPPPVQARKLRFVGNTAISSQELDGLVTEPLGQRPTQEELRGVARRVAEYYLAKGYVLARAFPRRVHRDSEEMEIAISEGRIGNLAVEGLSQAKAEAVLTAFGPLVGQGAVEGPALRVAVKSLAEREGLLITMRADPGALPGTLDLTVSRSASGAVEVIFPGGARRHLWPPRGGR
jgi:tRNA A-37 threonylcarbamoyl transferase component Bud32